MMPVENINHTEYPKSLRTKSEAALRYIIADAKAAIEANPEGHKAGYYADEICYAGMELARREKEFKELWAEEVPMSSGRKSGRAAVRI